MLKILSIKIDMSTNFDKKNLINNFVSQEEINI